MHIRKNLPTADAYLIRGDVFVQQVRGGLLLLLDERGRAYTVADGASRRLATASDLLDLVSCGEAVPVPGRGDRASVPLRRLRAPAPDLDVRSRRDPKRSAASPVEARATLDADDALTLGAFVHLRDPDADALAGYDVYLRAMARLSRRHRGAGLGFASPAAFRHRVEQVGIALADALQSEDMPTIH